VKVSKDRRSWQLGTIREVHWMANGTAGGLWRDWPYVLIAAGPEPAPTWRTRHMREECGVLPDLSFPEDRSWLVSALCDDTSTCFGGPHTLIEALEHDALVQAHRVQLGIAAKPPGRDRDYETPTEANPRMPQCYRDT
jgi:hypothetical protein